VGCGLVFQFVTQRCGGFRECSRARLKT
jgi:hypothetical protein